MKDKTVYILGAGASTPAIPIQSQIINEIFNDTSVFNSFFKKSAFMVSSDTFIWLSSGYKYFDLSRKKIADFLIRLFCPIDIFHEFILNDLNPVDDLKNIDRWNYFLKKSGD